MTDYNVIIETETDPGAPGKSSLWKRWWKNPLAMFEGAPGAPRLFDAALDLTAPSAAGAGWVGARQALVALGALGSYAMLSHQGITAATFAPGAIVAGASLRHSAAGLGVSTVAPSGSWRCMGVCTTDTAANIALNSTARVSLWLRIA